MSVEQMTAVLHHSKARGSARMVLLGIANHDGDGGAWPTVATLAKYAGLPDPEDVDDADERRKLQRNQARQVRGWLAELVRLGELSRDVNAGGTGDRHHWERPNLYRVLVECPPTCDGTTKHRRRRTPGHQSPGVTPESGAPRTPESGKPSIEPTTSVDPVSAQGDVRRAPATAPPAAVRQQLDAVREQLHDVTATVERRERRAS